MSSCIAIFGTGSDVGKSIVTTALCRIFTRRGIKVAPFKAQNMSNNSGITPEGLEMGRAQIVQAEASGLPPHVDMNPILLKPTTETGAQIVLLGKAIENSTAVEYHHKKEKLFASACAAFDRLQQQYDVIVMEGAGSCAEVNLMSHDIVNFNMAEHAHAPVILVADIHKGGVFAQITGTLECLGKKEQDMIKGFIINRFRGDISLFEDGVQWIEQKTSKKVFGVLPWFHHFKIDPEDSVVIENPESVSGKLSGYPSIAILRLPHISNFTDFEPLFSIEQIHACYIEKVQDINNFHAVILPGSKNTRYDLNWLNNTGWSDKIKTYSGKGGHVLGICGGYQMLGQVIHDPDGLDGNPGSTVGLSLLPIETILKSPKTTTLTDFQWGDISGRGYEIHMGQTNRNGGMPLLNISKRNNEKLNDEDGCTSNDSNVMGTYMHGFFDTPEVTAKWLETIGMRQVQIPAEGGLSAREKQYDLLADHFEKYIDIEGIISLSGK